ncbi:hypothetical protein C1645_130089 [Glomus cerebriforme]|uniref:Uncharacterized protein n=1 Tax=Glomus cerebriforme TaxID=658196 RepID=A0A397TJI0_9GLOM|nr:hypothetical protein C1645_130089 [Glomus cerebriforme]
MAFPQIKRRLSLFGSSTKSPPLTPQNLNNASLLTTYFPSQEIREDNPTPDDIRKSIENLQKLVLVADEYKDCVNKLSKISKNFSKCLKDYSNCKGINKSHVQCLQFAAKFYENHAEVQDKLNKALQKEFETLQKFWDKYSKKIAKDEKAHNDYVGYLDKQIKKISKDYEKKSKKAALESHDKYVASLTSIGSDIARARTEYTAEVTRRENHTHSVISQIFCRFIEGQFASFNDSLKKCGPNITKVKELALFAGQDVPSLLDLDSFLEMQIMTLPSESNNNNYNNNDDELISSGKPSRKSLFRISRSIASISEMQKAVMNNKPQGTVPSIEEFEKINTTEESLSPESQTPTTSVSEKSSDHVFSISIETTTTTIITESTNNETITSSAPPIVTPVTEINPPISSTNVPNPKGKPLSTKKPPTPNLLSSLSIGIHDDESPFFRDSGSRRTISSDTITEKTDSITIKSEETNPVETMTMIDKGNSINNEKECFIKPEENKIISLTPPPIYDKSRDIIKNNNKLKSLKKDQLKNEEINSSNQAPSRNTAFRISFIENNHENGVWESINKYSSNECSENEHHITDDKRLMNEKEIRPTSSFETERLVRSFPIDLPMRSVSQTPSEQKSNHDCDKIINNKEMFPYQHSDSLQYEEKHVAIHREFEDNMQNNSYVTYESPLTYSTKSYRDRSPSKQYDIGPRRAYTEYPLPNSKCGPSVADIRERLLLNANEKRQDEISFLVNTFNT